MTIDKRTIRLLPAVAAFALLATGVAACGGSASGGTASGSEQQLSGTIRVDGSSTVFPFIQAAAEYFNEDYPDVRITVGESGTGGGFEKFCAGETDISNASRPIKEDEEAPICKRNGVAYSQVQVANDGIAVVTSKDFVVDCLTTAQLKQVWDTGSKVRSLADVDPSLPGGELSLFGPGTDSGTFDFFTDVINGEEGATRDDFEGSEDDNQLVQGVSGSPNGLGYFGFSYFEANQDKLSLVGVDAGDGCVKPSMQTIQDGTYKPLARPLFTYVSAKSLERPEVKAFMEFAIANQAQIAEAARIVPLTEEQAQEAQAALTAAKGGAQD